MSVKSQEILDAYFQTHTLRKQAADILDGYTPHAYVTDADVAAHNLATQNRRGKQAAEEYEKDVASKADDARITHTAEEAASYEKLPSKWEQLKQLFSGIDKDYLKNTLYKNRYTLGAGALGATTFGTLAHLLSPEKYRRLATVIATLGGGAATAAAAHYAQKHYNA